MAANNQFNGIGNLTRDPELRSTPTGKKVVNLAVAINDPFDKENPTYIELQAWEKRAEYIGGNMHKGDQVAVSGTLKTENWTDKASGQKRSRLGLRIDDVFPLKLKSWDDRPREGATVADEPTETVPEQCGF